MDDNVFDGTLNKAIKLFIRTERLHHCVFDRKASTFGLHRSQHRMLMHLARKERAISQKQLAEELEISPAAVAVALKKLEELGFITRAASENDSRVKDILVTAKGKELTEATKKEFLAIDKAMFEGLDEEALNNFITCFEKMQENLKSM